MAWPNTMASRITALFFQLKFDDSPSALLNEKVLVGDMNFFLLEGGPEVKEKKALIVGGELLKFMDGMNIKLEDTGDRSKALKELITILKDGKEDSSKIPAAINTHFKFLDEE